MKSMMAGVVLVAASGAAVASGVGDVTSFVDQPRLFNDFGGSNLSYSSDFATGTVSIVENNYGSGNFANRHAAWYGDAGNNKVDFNYGDAFSIRTRLKISDATDVGNVEAGIQADLFGFGLFGVQTRNGEIAAFGSTNPFHSFGTGLYNVGDVILLEMTHRVGSGNGLDPIGGGTPSTMEYRYNNITQGSGWVSSGLKNFTTSEGGIPSFFPQFYGLGAQINQPGANGSVDVLFSGSSISVPTPGALGVVALAGLAAGRRRRA
jgi:MYXO-CTERM domain-containing protein